MTSKRPIAVAMVSGVQGIFPICLTLIGCIRKMQVGISSYERVKVCALARRHAPVPTRGYNGMWCDADARVRLVASEGALHMWRPSTASARAGQEHVQVPYYAC